MIHRPSIGRYMKLEEPKARESLLTPSMRSALSSPASAHPGSPKTPTAPGMAADTPPLSSQDSQTYSPMKQVEVANAALLERTAFAIDDAKDDDGSDADSGAGADDDEVLDEVCVVNFDHVPGELTLVCSG